MMHRVLLLVGLVSFSASANAEELDNNEHRMVEWIDSQTENVVALLKETVDVPSGTLNQEGVRTVGAIMRRELDELGLETEWVEMPADMNRAGHLFARKSGGSKNILLIGHKEPVTR